MLGTDVIDWCLLDSLPFKVSSSVHKVSGNAWYGRHWLHIGCCLLDSLPFKLSSFVHGVSEPFIHPSTLLTIFTKSLRTLGRLCSPGGGTPCIFHFGD